ncbi:MAG: putative lipid II flippase FtsW [Patescibacteria group bacterium]
MAEGGIFHGDKTFLALLGGVVLLGLVLLASASGPLGFVKFHDSYYLLKHQLIFGFLPGMIGFIVASRVPYSIFRRFAGIMLIVSLALLLSVFIPGLGTDLGTFAKQWIALGTFTLQPSEIVKLTFLFYIAAWMEKRTERDLQDVHAGLIPFVIVLSVVMGILLLQHDTGTLGIIVAMALGVYFVAGAPIRYFFAFGGAGVVMFALLLKFSAYRYARLVTFLHPELDPKGAGYHINQALLAIGSGGFLGRGYGHSLQKFQYLPEVAGDSIFAVIGEELGFLLTTAFLVLYVTFLQRGFRIAANASDAFGRYLATGVMCWIGAQTIVNIGAMVGILPITGVPLPLVSYGGTALAVTLTALGVVVNVSAHAKAA